MIKRYKRTSEIEGGDTYCREQNLALLLRNEFDGRVDATLLFTLVEGTEAAHDRHVPTLVGSLKKKYMTSQD